MLAVIICKMKDGKVMFVSALESADHNDTHQVVKGVGEQ